MRDSNFLIENNARHLWHPMAHPAEMQAKPPRIINGGAGVEVVDIHGKTVLDAVGGLWNVNLGYSCEPVKQAIRDQLDARRGKLRERHIHIREVDLVDPHFFDIRCDTHNPRLAGPIGPRRARARR